MALDLNISTPSLHFGSRDFSGRVVIQDFLVSNLYTIVVSCFVTLALFLYNRPTAKSKSHGYPYAGYRTWWEPAFWVRLRFVLSAVEILKSGYTKVLPSPKHNLTLRY